MFIMLTQFLTCPKPNFGQKILIFLVIFTRLSTLACVIIVSR